MGCPYIFWAKSTAGVQCMHVMHVMHVRVKRKIHNWEHYIIKNIWNLQSKMFFFSFNLISSERFVYNVKDGTIQGLYHHYIRYFCKRKLMWIVLYLFINFLEKASLMSTKIFFFLSSLYRTKKTVTSYRRLCLELPQTFFCVDF